MSFSLSLHLSLFTGSVVLLSFEPPYLCPFQFHSHSTWSVTYFLSLSFLSLFCPLFCNKFTDTCYFHFHFYLIGHFLTLLLSLSLARHLSQWFCLLLFVLPLHLSFCLFLILLLSLSLSHFLTLSLSLSTVSVF